MLCHVSIFHSFLSLNNVPLCDFTSLFTHSSVLDIWVVYGFHDLRNEKTPSRKKQTHIKPWKTVKLLVLRMKMLRKTPNLPTAFSRCSKHKLTWIVRVRVGAFPWSEQLNKNTVGKAWIIPSFKEHTSKREKSEWWSC